MSLRSGWMACAAVVLVVLLAAGSLLGPSIHGRYFCRKVPLGDIEVPAHVWEAIQGYGQKEAVPAYLTSPSISREHRLQYLENVRVALAPDLIDSVMAKFSN